MNVKIFISLEVKKSYCVLSFSNVIDFMILPAQDQAALWIYDAQHEKFSQK